MLKLTTGDLIEMVENFRIWVTMQDTFGGGPSQEAYENAHWTILDMLYESGYNEAHDLFYAINHREHFTSAHLKKALDVVLEVIK